MNLMPSARIRAFLQSESALVISALVAIASMTAFPPTPEHLPEYFAAVDLRTIGLLFCLMTAVAGLTRAGVLGAIRARLAKGHGSMRRLAVLLTLISFFSSMIVTNDVALISFVPLTLLLFRSAPQHVLVITLVTQTVAANLGSMLTPIGNPQNIYLYSTFGLDPVTFLRVIAPYGTLGLALSLAPGTLGLALSLAPCLLIPTTPLAASQLEETPIQINLLLGYLGIFALSLSCVAHLVSWEICTVVTVGTCLAIDRKVLTSIDYSLLATFACFFIFVGNIKHIDALTQALQGVLVGREVLVSALASQVISNVPAAIMLSGFTGNAAGLLVGTNIGGLGTPVASLASLITLRLYARSHKARTGLFLRWFMAVNALFLLLLLVVATFLS